MIATPPFGAAGQLDTPVIGRYVMRDTRREMQSIAGQLCAAAKWINRKQDECNHDGLSGDGGTVA
jgi:hypothetical protein